MDRLPIYHQAELPDGTFAYWVIPLPAGEWFTVALYLDEEPLGDHWHAGMVTADPWTANTLAVTYRGAGYQAAVCPLTPYQSTERKESE